MPVFDFADDTGHVISVMVPLKAPDQERHTQLHEGRTYRRVYAAPLAAADIRPQDGTRADFHRTLGNKKLKVGDLWKASKEMSAERAARNGGVDPVKEEYYRNYERKMKDKHPDVKKREIAAAMAKTLRAQGIHVD